MRDTIYRDEAIKAIKDHSFALGDDYLEINGYGAIDDIRALPSADRPSGEVDAVKEYEHHAHNLNQGYITLGEFDKRIEPLRHLHYDRPQGWIPCSERLPEERQDVYVTVFWDDYGDTITAYGMRTQFGWLLWNTAEGELLKGYTVTAWMPLPEPWRGADDE